MLKGFGDLFKESFSELKEKFTPIFKSFLFLYLIPMAIVFVIFMGLFVAGSFASDEGANITGIAISDFNFGSVVSAVLVGGGFSYGLIVVGFILVIILVVLMILLSISYLYIALFGKKQMSFKHIFGAARTYFWRYVGLCILLAILLVILFILFIIPGIIFFVYWLFAAYVLMNEKLSPWDSMKRSKQIVKGRWWRTFGILLLIGVIVSFASLIIGLIPLIGGLVTSLLLTPFSIIFFKNMYLDMKKNKK